MASGRAAQGNVGATPRIKTTKSVRRSMRRFARSRLRDAARALKDTKHPLGERVHQVRTSIKKVRAVAALARPAVGKHARRADRRLRKVAASTSALRDAEVLLATFDALWPSLAVEAQSNSLRLARRRLMVRLRQTTRAFRAEGQIDRLVAQLRAAHRGTKRWVPRKGTGGSRAAVLGLVDGYRRARRAMKVAFDQPSGTAFHRWRKTVKAHRYQLALWEAWPKHARPAMQALERLGDVLGEEHDLTVLAQVVATDRASFPEERDRARLLAVSEDRRRVLRADAGVLGERLFAERPRAFGRRVRDELGARPGRQRSDGVRGRPSVPPVLRLA